MKCTSCESEINPKWKHAVESNLCPFCGQLIMDADLKALLSTLSVTLEKLSDHPDHLEDWLRTHGYVREDKIVYPAPVAVPVHSPVPVNKDTVAIQSQEVTNKFFKNAEATKIVGKTQHYKEMVSQIKKQGATALTANTLGGMINPEDLNTADPQVVADLQEILGSSPEIASSLPDGGDGEEDIHPIALAMASMAGGKGGQNNAKDLMKLQQLQSKTASARNRMLTGSSGKGSFSRS
jgi:Zn-finger nucleic acid-binding protein